MHEAVGTPHSSTSTEEGRRMRELTVTVFRGTALAAALVQIQKKKKPT